MFGLPNPTNICTVSSMTDYHIFSFGDEFGVHVVTVMREGKCHDSYVVCPNGGKDSYITLPFEKE